jgi:hypothetical protein
MKNTLTIGTIWKDKRSGKEFELVAQNKENGSVQVSSIDNEQDYKCMMEVNLRKHYSLVALTLKAYRPELTTVTQIIEEPIISTPEPVKPVVNDSETVEQVSGNTSKSRSCLIVCRLTVVLSSIS